MLQISACNGSKLGQWSQLGDSSQLIKRDSYSDIKAWDLKIRCGGGGACISAPSKCGEGGSIIRCWLWWESLKWDVGPIQENETGWRSKIVYLVVCTLEPSSSNNETWRIVVTYDRLGGIEHIFYFC